ncbi:MAG: hypothetical protein AAGI51_11710, partial [Pseudomonadota bacterium]
MIETALAGAAALAAAPGAAWAAAALVRRADAAWRESSLDWLEAAGIIIGTQMVAKGHNFPLLTLVGVIDADMGLAGGDLR